MIIGIITNIGMIDVVTIDVITLIFVNDNRNYY
jgi:hypothetical protein